MFADLLARILELDAAQPFICPGEFRDRLANLESESTALLATCLSSDDFLNAKTIAKAIVAARANSAQLAATRAAT